MPLALPRPRFLAHFWLAESLISYFRGVGEIAVWARSGRIVVVAVWVCFGRCLDTCWSQFKCVFGVVWVHFGAHPEWRKQMERFGFKAFLPDGRQVLGRKHAVGVRDGVICPWCKFLTRPEPTKPDTTRPKSSARAGLARPQNI